MITQSISWPEISTTDVTRHNRLYACAGVRLKLGTSSWQVRFPPVLSFTYDPRITLELVVLERQIFVELERLPFEADMAALLGEVVMEALPKDLQLALVSEVLGSSLERLGFLLGGSVQVVQIEDTHHTETEQRERVALALDGDLGSIFGRLFFEAADWPRFLSLLEQHKPAQKTWGHVPMKVQTILGFTMLPLDDAADLSLGDLVLVDVAYTGEQAALLIADVAFWRVSRHEQIYTLEEEMAMPESFEMEPHNPLENPNLNLIFEVGQQEIRLDALRQLAAGSVIPTEKRLGDGITIRINGLVAGRGELVAMGDQLAVRILELHSEQAADSLAEVIP